MPSNWRRTTPPPYGVLAHSEIARLLKAGWLLRGEAEGARALREAGYDLSIATDFCVTPDGRCYDFGETPKNAVIVLKPGEMALVSTKQRLCLPPMVGAQIGIKFSYASAGILVLTGSFVDPGYGLSTQEWRAWLRRGMFDCPEPMEPSDISGRLHFYLINHGQEDFVVKLGVDLIATLQFFTVAGHVPEPAVPRGQVLDLRREFGFDGSVEGARPLRFGLLQTVEQRLANLERSGTALKSELEATRTDINGVRNGTLPFIQLGLFLVAATLFGVVLDTLTSLSGSPALERLVSIWRDLGGGENLGFIVLGIGIAIAGVAYLLAKTIESFVNRSTRGRSASE